MKVEYGEDVELPPKKAEPVPKAKSKENKSEWEVFQNHDDFEGGFLREDEPADSTLVREAPGQARFDDGDMAGGFFAASQEEPEHGDLTIDHGNTEAETHRSVVESSYQTPMSLTSTLQQPADQSSAPDDHEDEIVDLDSPADTEENSGDESPPPRRKTTATRGRARSRATKATPASTRKRKSMLVDSLDDEDLAIPDLPPTPPASTRAAPKRKAARKSDAHVKSHFFAEGSESETDLTDITDWASPKKAARGGKSARGWGRGR
ncbi:hypothetical protein BKA58DRAFT_387273 [Alternaria rosae]|uniref:uncharacterized protein n=1 Tax=Alternaria rosae TaxID=1187941 RepID=UPI001E8E459F|nr:uncharacterized protein BKA58DRAFT_387273 [Alternaria rosae]KAH6868629.1 hypothetical protein BKA58DRAFT_387273 [Alternaria rosae]